MSAKWRGFFYLPKKIPLHVPQVLKQVVNLSCCITTNLLFLSIKTVQYHLTNQANRQCICTSKFEFFTEISFYDTGAGFVLVWTKNQSHGVILLLSNIPAQAKPVAKCPDFCIALNWHKPKLANPSSNRTDPSNYAAE